MFTICPVQISKLQIILIPVDQNKYDTDYNKQVVHIAVCEGFDHCFSREIIHIRSGHKLKESEDQKGKQYINNYLKS